MSGHILFSAFHKDNLIDKLLGELKENFNWNLDEIDSVFHKYHWCNILLTEEIKLKPNEDFTIELLGEYSNERKEIKLFILKIEEYVRSICENNKDRKNHIEKLTYIVLIHEMVHWIVYAVKDHEVRVFEKTGDTGEDKTNFHEGLAQYFTWYIIHNDSELLESFDELCTKQPNEYNVFRELIGKNISDIMIAISVLRKLNRQSWKFLKLAIKTSEKDESDFIKKQDITEFIHKHRGIFISNKYGI